jgi:hypothetical protein
LHGVDQPDIFDDAGKKTTPVSPPTVPPRGDAGVVGDRSVSVDAKVADAGGAKDDGSVPDRTSADTGPLDAPGWGSDADPSPIDAEAGAPDSRGGVLDVASADMGTPDRDVAIVSDVIDAKTTVDADVTRDARCTGTTHDEDNDGIVDTCDNCPTVANANQADVGELNAGHTPDGVGDACDPRPTETGESILLFDPFTSGQIGSDWQVNGGTWQANSGTIAETATGNVQELDRVSFGNLSDYLVETMVTLDALPNNDSRATVVSRMDASTHNGWGCAVKQSVLVFSMITNGDAGESNPPSDSIPTPQVGSRYRIQSGGFGNNLYCILPDTGHSVPRTNSTYPSGVPGLRSFAAASTWRYMLVYRLGGPLP